MTGIILPHGFSVIPLNARVAFQLQDLSLSGSLNGSKNSSEERWFLFAQKPLYFIDPLLLKYSPKQYFISSLRVV